jgi:hypothetical protein
LDISTILSGNNFELTTTAQRDVLLDATTKSFRIEFGPQLGDQLSTLISENVGEPWENILLNYSTLEDSLKKIFRAGSTDILNGIRHEILKILHLPETSNLSNQEILESINFNDVFKYLQNLNRNQHPILLFVTKTFRDKIIREFFNTNIPDNAKGCFSENSNSSNKKIITYDEIVTENKINTTKINQFLTEIHHQNQTKFPSRFACENTIWFKNQGLFEEHQQIGSGLDQQVVSHSCILCCYNLNELTDENIQRIIQSRGIIILETPISIFKRCN